MAPQATILWGFRDHWTENIFYFWMLPWLPTRNSNIKLEILQNTENVLLPGVSIFQKKGDILYFFADRNQTVNLGMHSEAHTSVSVNPDPYPLCVPCHAFVSRNSIRALGFLHLPNFEHGYSDHYLGCIYKEVGQYHLHSGPKPFTIHNRPSNQVDREHPLWDDIYETKSVLTDAEGRTADDRDKIKFDEFRMRYLALHQQIILNLHANRWQQTFPKRY